MKKTAFLPLLCLAASAVCASVPEPTADSLRTLTISVVNKRGKTVKNTAAFGLLTSDSTRRMFPLHGRTELKCTGTDTLYLVCSGLFGALPLEGLDSARIVLSGKQLRAGSAKGRTINIGYEQIPEYLNVLPANRLDPDQDLSVSGYTDLASYLKGRIAGVDVVGEDGNYEIRIRGTNSFMLSTGALIVVDGQVFDNFDTVNRLVNISDIRTVEVLKDGAIYGSRGANGVVIITTKSSRP